MTDLLREEHLCEIILNFGFVFIFLFLAPVAIFFQQSRTVWSILDGRGPFENYSCEIILSLGQ